MSGLNMKAAHGVYNILSYGTCAFFGFDTVYS
jgi:hypothetical protein